MSREELRAFLDILMCSDPWPIKGDNSREILDAFATAEARRHGFADWLDAYHHLLRVPS